MKKLFFTLILIFSSIIVVDATSISNIDMNIFVDDYGTAHVEEIWTAYVSEGTEGWHPYYNLGNSKISDLQVTMDGKSYTTVDNWNVNASINEKAYKAGIYYVDGNEIDLCFGISSYGNHTYNIKYKISNFVSTVNDADMIYWNLFPSNFSAEPGNVDITIYSDFKYEDTLDVWGYGKYGAPSYVYDGKIEMTSDSLTVYSHEYMTILVKFPKGTFQTSNVLDNNFDYYLDMAEEGATNYNDDYYIKEDNKTNYVDDYYSKEDDISLFEYWLIIGIIWVIFIIIIYRPKSIKKTRKNIKFGENGNEVKKYIPNFREIPCNKDIFRAYWVASNYNLVKKNEDFLGAVLLKWLNNGTVKVEKIIKETKFKRNEEINIIFVSRPTDIEVEAKLYDYMFKASHDGNLKNNEFKRWCSNNYTKIFKWFDEVIEYENEKLSNECKLIKKISKGIFSKTVYHVDSSMMVEAEQMAGLKNFLKEFTLIKEREPIEVSLWNEYLMYAQIFGIADKVAEQFKKLYPEVINDMEQVGYSYNEIDFVHSITSNGIRSASDARRRVSNARSRAESYSSGGGGFSSGGGGGGSFGGGGGGGGFR